MTRQDRVRGHRLTGRHRMDPSGQPTLRWPPRERPAVGTLVAVLVGSLLAAAGAAVAVRASSASQDELSLRSPVTPSASTFDSGQEPTPTQELQQPQVNSPIRKSLTAVPANGSGVFDTVAGASEVIGVGELVTYKVEVEEDLAFPGKEVARTVDETLTDRRGWTASGNHALQRRDSETDVRIVLATPGTTDSLCAPLDTGGRLSCRTGDVVVLNAWRWMNGSPAYAGDIKNYRRYLINHEFGHALGEPHESCQGEGELAPVMLQQTKGVDACLPNPWPVPTGKGKS